MTKMQSSNSLLTRLRLGPGRNHGRRRKYRADAFFITILLLSVVALYSYVAVGSNKRQEIAYRNSLARRDGSDLGAFGASDAEVGQPSCAPISVDALLTHAAVPSSASRRRPVRLHCQTLP